MNKHYFKLTELNSNTIYRRYLWRHDRLGWVNFITRRLFYHARPFFITLILLSPIILSSPISSGNIDKHFIAQQIMQIQETLPVMEKALGEIDKLSNSISKVAYKDLDRSFIYSFLIVKWAGHYGIDPKEVAGVIQTESEFELMAKSRKDARGLMQVHQPSWKMADPFDGEKNIEMGSKILYLYKRSYPSSYLSKYSGGATNYKQKVLKNMKKIKST